NPYVQLHVRLNEAQRLAERLHTIDPSRESYRLRAEVALALGDADTAQSIAGEGLERYDADTRLRDVLSRAQAQRKP
ncbi:MAG: hypothetical protein AAF488_19905, partial [Planctomycetota bacterium]